MRAAPVAVVASKMAVIEGRPVRILFVEDSEDDVKLALRALRAGGFAPSHVRVQTAAGFTAALADGPWEAVISDFAMPGFTGLDALRIFQSAGMDIPFILVSGTIGEEFAADAMKAGASDYVMKGNLARLAPALERELEEAATRADLRFAHEALAASEEQFRQMADNIRDVFFLVDAHTGHILYVNDAYESITGLSPESVHGKPWTDVIHPDDRASVLEKRTAGKLEYEHRIQCPDGSIRWIESRGFPVRNETGEVVRIAGVAKDITEHKRAEQALRQNEERTRLIVESALDAVVAMDSCGRITGWNAQAEKIFGWTRQDVIGTSLAETIVPARYRNAHAAGLRMFLDTGKGPILGKRIEISAMHRDGHEFPIELSVSPLKVGEEWIFSSFVRDLTEQRRGEAALRRFRAAMDASGDAIVLIDRASMRYIDVNQTLCDMTGLTRQELIGKTAMEVFSADRETLERDYDAIIADRNNSANLVVGQYRHKDGSVIPVESRRRALQTENGWVIVATARDVTERKAAEDRIIYLNRVYAVLSGINTLIVRAKDREELFAEACRIAVEIGGFRIAWIGIVERALMKLVPVASSGDDVKLVPALAGQLALSECAAVQNTLTLRAIRQKSPIVSNDSQSDPQVAFSGKHVEAGIRSMAILPLIVADEAVGVLGLYASEVDFFHEEELKLLTRLAGDIAFAVEHIEKAQKLDRMTRVNAMLSGINGAIVRIRDPQELYEEACRIAVETGGLPFAMLCIVDEAEARLRPIATAGTEAGYLETIRDRLSLLDGAPQGHGISAQAVREKRILVVNDVQADPTFRFRRAHAERGIKSIAALPILIAGRVIGAFVLHAAEVGYFNDDEVNLLREMSANIALALDHMAKEEKVRRLTRVYAMQSGISSLIVRARDCDELFREACRIAVEAGHFAKAWVGIVERESNQFRMLAAHGGDPLFFPILATELNKKFLGGSGYVTTALTTLAPAISNDMQGDAEVLLKDSAVEGGARSMALLPLVVAGEAVGVFALNAQTTGFFDAEEMKLLTGLAGDIAFAIDHLAKQERLDYLAYYDVLTGLPNRSLFLERVTQYSRSAAAAGHGFALFFIDLERFKNINESLGRPAGDALLKQVAGLLKSGEGDPNLVARVGADHFAVVMPEVKDEDDVVRFLDDRIGRFQEHLFHLNDAVFRIAMKVGVSMFPKDGADAETLLRNAEAALKKAKSGGDRYLFYKQKMTDMRAGNLTLENKLRSALEKEEYVLHYQPKVSLLTGKLTGAEALIRWNDPQTGLVPPGQFIPILEETGLIHEVGRWALRKAIQEYLRWAEAGLPAVRIAVNVSPLQLRDRGFVAGVEQAICVDSRAAAGLELEITESLIMENVKHSIVSLQAICDMKVTLAIDDFGTGFSSLSYLSKLPVDTLKIDRSFVIDMTTGPDGLSLVSTIINLAHALKLKVVAEGVETEEQSRLLRLLNCDEMQGYLFSRPVPADVFEAKFLAPGAAE